MHHTSPTTSWVAVRTRQREFELRAQHARLAAEHRRTVARRHQRITLVSR